MTSPVATIVIIYSVAVATLTEGSNPTIQFNIDEELPSGYTVGSIANKSKPFLNYNETSLLYNFLPPTDANTLFSINDQTGIIFTSVVIDRERVCEYDSVCKIEFDVAVSSSDRQFFQIVSVQIFVNDKNDNAPLFPVDVYHLNISEGSSSGSYSLQQAIDKDTGANNSIQNYSLLLNSDSEGYFWLNTQKNLDGTFLLKLVLQKTLDREVKDTYNVEVIAKDGGNPPKTGILNVVVHVLDINDNAPEFTQQTYNVSVKENLAAMETILSLSAKDKDIGENARVTYRISEFQKDKAALDEIFLVSAETGDLKVKSDLSAVSGMQFDFIVEAVDHGAEPLFSQAQVIVNIEDYGNNAPVVSVSYISTGNTGFVNISENAKNTSFVAHVNVEDQDSGLNGQVDCEVSNKHFAVVRMDKGFKVVVNAVLDREVLNTYNLTVTCYDKGSPVMSGSAHFVVRITDFNDNKPKFVEETYTAKLSENNAGNEMLLKVSANDADEDKNAVVYYEVDSDAKGRFIVDRMTGVLSANDIFDREKEPTITFHVLAIDNGTPALTGMTTVVITLEDENDNAPVFKKSVHGFTLLENQATGSDVATLEAFDLDEGANAEFDFAVDQDYLEQVPFVLLPNGLLKANKQLDREERSRYDFVAVVTDRGDNHLSSLAHVTVIVEDMNDNSPVVTFPRPSNNSVTLYYPDFESEYVATIEAYDLDEGKNKELQFSIRSGNEQGIFRIDKDSGEINFAQQVDIGADRVIALELVVSDKGDIPLETVTILSVELKYTNATFRAMQGDSSNSKYIIISVVVVIVTLVISGVIIGVIFVLRTMDKKRKLKEGNDSQQTIDSEFGFTPVTQSHTIISKDTLSSGSGEGRDLIKKKEVSFILDNNDSFDYHQQQQHTSNPSVPAEEKPSKSSLRYSPQVTTNVLDTRELQNEANAQLQSMKLQQMILQSRAKQWVQQQQQQYGIVHHDDRHSDGSAETIGSDSGRGCSEEDDVFSTPSADDPKLFEISSPESQHSYLQPQIDMYMNTQRIGVYTKQPWTRKPHLAHKDYKSTCSQLSLNRNLGLRHSVHVDNLSNNYTDLSANRSSWGSAYYSSMGPMDFTGDSALHSFFEKTPVNLHYREDDDNCSTTTSGSYTIQSEEIL